MSNKDFDAECWLASLFSEMIKRGISEDEHIHFHESPLDGSPAPSLNKLKQVSLKSVSEILYESLLDHRDEIINDYEKLEKKE